MNILHHGSSATQPEIEPRRRFSHIQTLQRSLRSKVIPATVVAQLLGLTCAIGASAEQAEDPTGTYFCSLKTAVEVVNGENTYSALDRYLTPPSKTEIPVTEDREFIVAEGYDETKKYYWYIKEQPTTIGTYTIHGLFDFEAKTLSTARSSVSKLVSGGLGTIGASFLFLCESVD